MAINLPQVVCLLAMAGVVIGHNYDLEDFQTNEIFASRRISTTLNCKIGDQFCNMGCNEVVMCLANNELFVIQNCTETPSTPTCDSASLTCKSTASASCDKTFPCHAEGMFPNPYDCHSYYVCPEAKGNALPRYCPDDDHDSEYAYDPLTTLCRLSSYHRVCRDNPIPPCSYMGQTGAQQENPNIYYICSHDNVSSILVPWLFRCSKGYEVYDEDTMTCAYPTPSTTTPYPTPTCPTATPCPTITTPWPTTTRPPTTTPWTTTTRPPTTTPWPITTRPTEPWPTTPYPTDPWPTPTCPPCTCPSTHYN